MIALKVGEVFLYRGTNSELDYFRNDTHIHIVVNIDEHRRDAYLVPLSTSPVFWDKACEIGANDGCPFVTKRCYVAYVHAKKVPLGGTMRDWDSGEMPAALLARVIAGVPTSVHTPQWFRDAIFPVRKMTIHRDGRPSSRY
jgi:hypothetical protein